MHNIKFEGIYRNEKQLKKVELPENSIVFDEPDDINSLLLKGAIVSLPIIITILFITVATLYMVIKGGNIESKTLIGAIIISCFFTFVLQFVHELIHAIVFPKKAKKEIYISKDLMSLFVYCTEHVSKLRFIIIAIAPNIILGVIPFFFGVLFKDTFSPIISLTLVFIGGILCVMGMGDYFNIYNTVNQVPGNGVIFNSGLHSFWYANEDDTNFKSDKISDAFWVLLYSLGCFLLSFKNEMCILLFFIIIMMNSMKKGLFNGIFKWVNVVTVLFAYLIILGHI